jgi:hypothetical protein
MIYMLTTLAPVWARAMSAALAMVVIHLIGPSLGPWLIGQISSFQKPQYGEE